jgi:RNA polymerase sigma factor (sigma-70 family)
MLQAPHGPPPLRLDLLRSGDRSAFDGFVSVFWKPVTHFLTRRVPLQDVDDLAQNSFALVYQSVLRGKGPRTISRSVWLRYLYKCARNQVKDYYRRRRTLGPTLPIDDLLRQGEEHIPAARSALDPALAAFEESDALHDCMRRLPAPGRALFWLHFVEGMSKREIARALGVPESSLRTHFGKALASVRACLHARSIDGPGSLPARGLPWWRRDVYFRT